VQGVAGHPGGQGSGQEKNNRKKWRADEEERHMGSPTQKRSVWLKRAAVIGYNRERFRT
jgi:hypothetical protein